MARTEEWKQEFEQNFWVNGYTDACSAKKRLDEEYAEYKSILTEVGLAKINQAGLAHNRADCNPCGLTAGSAAPYLRSALRRASKDLSFMFSHSTSGGLCDSTSTQRYAVEKK